MVRLLSGAALVVTLLTPAYAQDMLREGRSVSTCSESLLVCAFARDGHASATSECQAEHEGAIRILPGDCEDPD